MLKLLIDELRNRRGAIIGWGLGIAIFAGYIIILYPEFAEPMENFNFEDIAIYQALGDFGDMASFKGFVTAEVFTFLPILLAIYAIVNGTGTLAGEEDDGTLEPILALPLPRWQILISKTLALALALLLVLIIVGLAAMFSFSTLPGDVDTGGIDGGSLLVGTLATWPLLFLFATLSFFLAAFMPSRRIASISAVIVLVVSYFGNNLTGFVAWLENVKFLFPFNYYDPGTTLLEGPNVENMLILLAASAVFLALALISFQRRNITVGAWPWQRGRVPVTETD